MPGVRVDRGFFERDTVTVARAMLGKVLISRVGGERVGGVIVECEAYLPGDSTSHSFRGRTARNASMFAAPGTAYVYFTYGMHYCANIATESAGIGAAVLIRAITPVEGIDVMRARRGAHHPTRDLCRGPARLCVALGIARSLDGVDTCADDAPLFLEDAPALPLRRIKRSARVGVNGTDRDIRAQLRFYVDNEPHVSGPRVVKTDRSR